MAFQCSRVVVLKPLSGCLVRGILPFRLKVPVASASHAAALRDNEDFAAKNARLGRPQSPHLTIYQPQLTWLLSLTHRTTGMALGGIATMWGIGGLFMSGHFSENMAVLQNMHLSPTLIILAKATLAFPFCFHFANGIRHLFLIVFILKATIMFLLPVLLREIDDDVFLQAWDFGKFLSIREVYLTGYAVLGVSAIFTAYLASL